MSMKFRYIIRAAFLFATLRLAGQTPDSTTAVQTLDSLYKVVREITPKAQYERAEEICARAAVIAENTFGINSGPYGNYNYVHTYVKLMSGKYEEALPYAIRARELMAKHYGPEDITYARSVNNLAICYRNLDNYEAAEPLYLESLGIRERKAGKENADYAMALNNMGNYYYIIGKYLEAEKLHLEARAIRNRVLPEGHPDYLLSLFNLANIYSDLGNYEEGEKLFLQVKSIEEKFPEKSRKEYGQTLNNLGNLYRRAGNYARAEEMLTASLAVREEVLGKKHADYFQSLENLGIVYRRKKEFEKAEGIFLECVQNSLEKNGEKSGDYARSMHNLANIYLDTGRYPEAQQLCEKAIDITTEVYGVHYYLHRAILSSLAKSYFEQNNQVAWKSTLYRLRDLGHTETEDAKKFLSPHELEIFVNEKGGFTLDHSLLQYAWNTGGKEVAGDCYNELLYFKGLQLSAGDFRRVNTTTDSSLTAKYDSLKIIHRQIARQYSIPNSRRDHQKLIKLEETSNLLEKELVRVISGFGENNIKIDYKQVQKTLKSGETAVEFTHFMEPNELKVVYAAFVLFYGDTTVSYLPLFREEKLEALLNRVGDNANATNSLYATRSGELLDATPVYGTDMYNLIWRPIDSLLRAKSVKTVYYSPSGLLHRVSFAALPVSSRKVLANRYSLNQLGSTRSLVQQQAEPLAHNLNVQLFGGVQYETGAKSATDSTISSTDKFDNLLWKKTLRTAITDDKGIEYLPGTLAEAKKLYKLFSENNITAKKHTGIDATEEALKLLGQDTSRSPGILHIATHGFIFPDPDQSDKLPNEEQNAYSSNKNPLLRSGLLMAGANDAWQGKQIPGDREDGVATAFEISKLNLSATRLAVLSACQTGLGDINSTEGVYGLQRAFKMAGVDYLLVSLWQVPDTETAVFMDSFYSEWLKGRTLHQAFEKTQKKMRKKYRDTYRWGAWVLAR